MLIGSPRHLRFRKAVPSIRPPEGYVDIFWDRVANALKALEADGTVTIIGGDIADGFVIADIIFEDQTGVVPAANSLSFADGKLRLGNGILNAEECPVIVTEAP